MVKEAATTPVVATARPRSSAKAYLDGRGVLLPFFLLLMELNSFVLPLSVRLYEAIVLVIMGVRD